MPIDYEFGFLHIKAVDDAGHDRCLERKLEFYEKTDKMIEKIVKTLAPISKENVFLSFYHYRQA